MILSLEFCERRAGDAADAASHATLDNVRDRELRSEAAWLALASKVKTVKDGRKAIEEFRALDA